MHPQPENTGQAVGEPANEGGSDETQQAVEDRDGLGDDHGESPDHEGDTPPRHGGELGPAFEVLGIAEQADEDVLGGHVTVDDSGDDL